MASGVGPHAGVSWEEKYKYMDNLCLKQKEEMAALQMSLRKQQEEIAKMNAEIANITVETTRLHSVIEGKNAEISSFTATIFAML
jgi:septal ring factor EnvC (AmiA/AmiB activator)